VDTGKRGWLEFGRHVTSENSWGELWFKECISRIFVCGSADGHCHRDLQHRYRVDVYLAGKTEIGQRRIVSDLDGASGEEFRPLFGRALMPSAPALSESEQSPGKQGRLLPFRTADRFVSDGSAYPSWQAEAGCHESCGGS
jgi:hypothetical protein